MFKRFFSKFSWGASKPPEEKKLDLKADFGIVIPVKVQIPISPLESFTERAQAAILAELADLGKKTRTAMFHPLPDGTLRVFTPSDDTPEVKN